VLVLAGGVGTWLRADSGRVERIAPGSGDDPALVVIHGRPIFDSGPATPIDLASLNASFAREARA
jgi:hypothetical protein